MIQFGTRLHVADNTGAQRVKCITVLRGYQRRYARLGDVITVVVKSAQPHGMVKKSDVLQAVIVRQAKEFHRRDGSHIRFGDNACVLIEKNGDPKGTRIFGPVGREVKLAGFHKIASLAPEVL